MQRNGCTVHISTSCSYHHHESSLDVGLSQMDAIYKKWWYFQVQVADITCPNYRGHTINHPVVNTDECLVMVFVKMHTPKK